MNLHEHHKQLSKLGLREPTLIAERLYMGSAPLPQDDLHVDVVALCAEEYQPKWLRVPHVIYGGFDDAEIDAETLYEAGVMAKQVGAAIRAGKRVLVTCMQGRNRSGLVVALVLVHYYGLSGEDAVTLIRKRRGRLALSNDRFRAFLKSYNPMTRRRARA